jgi:hypothetical protein
MNEGVVTREHLGSLGITDDAIRTFVAHGDLVRLYRGVYADGRAKLTDRSRLKGALLAVGPGTWLAGRSAASVWGLAAAGVASIDLGIAAEHTPRHEGLRIARSVEQPHPTELRRRRGLPVSSISRLLIEAAAAGASKEWLLETVEAAARRGLFSTVDLNDTLARHAGERGVGVVKAAAAAYLPGPRRKSNLERSFDRWLPARDFERDRLKDAWLQKQGLRILRASGDRWANDRHGVHTDLLALLALGRAAA